MDTLRKSVTLAASMWREVEQFRQKSGIVTLSDAVRRLIRAGLDAEARRR